MRGRINITRPSPFTSEPFPFASVSLVSIIQTTRSLSSMPISFFRYGLYRRHLHGKRISNMGSLYQDMGQYNRALPLFEQALQICENAFGPRHMDVASTQHLESPVTIH